jgi:hypothetical protein
MECEARVIIASPREAVWERITDIENCADFISGIQQVRLRTKPEAGLVGLEWTETRTLFGKTATETMWITEAVEYEYYRTRAESHGAVYTSTSSLADVEGGTELTMRFGAVPVSLGAKVMALVMGRFVMGATRKALQQDLDDIKHDLEGRPAA